MFNSPGLRIIESIIIELDKNEKPESENLNPAFFWWAIRNSNP
jgi:hypothetical protein